MNIDDAFIAELFVSDWKGVIAATGGGSSAISRLLEVPGASHFLLEGIVPYSAAALVDWLGREPEQFCSESTALAMAARAHARAASLVHDPNHPTHGSPLVGLGVTASLVSVPPKRGPHRAHIAVVTDSYTAAWSMQLTKGARSRIAEEAMVRHMTLATLNDGTLRSNSLSSTLPTQFPEDTVHQARATLDPLLVEVRNRARSIAWLEREGEATDRRPAGLVGLLCGSFNPVHEGHLELIAVAEKRLGGPVGFELSITNVDKPPLDALSITRRLASLRPHRPVAITSAPLFVEKALAIPNLTFVVGFDTAERILAPRYYKNMATDRDAALREIAHLGARFLVAGRRVGESFRELNDLPIPTEFAHLFEAIPASEFQRDISSTELRRQNRSD